MLKFFFLALGFVVLFEGLVYFIFANKMKNFYKVISLYEPEKLRFISSLLIIVGLCLIYFTLKFYKTN